MRGPPTVEVGQRLESANASLSKTRLKWYTMTPLLDRQQDFLYAAKVALDVDWDTLALRAGIKPRAFKSYRLPESSKGFRAMPDLARAAIDDLLRTSKKEPHVTQQQYLRDAMARLKLTWPQLAEAAGIKTLTFKNYLRSDEALAHRKLPPLARAAIERLLRDQP